MKPIWLSPLNGWGGGGSWLQEGWERLRPSRGLNIEIFTAIAFSSNRVLPREIKITYQ